MARVMRLGCVLCVLLLNCENSSAQAKIRVTTTVLPVATAGSPYSVTLAATGGQPPYTWTVTGTLPAGLAFGSNGAITGTPSVAGRFAFEVRVRDSRGDSDEQKLNLTVTAPLVIATASLPSGTVGAPYSQSLTATGGSGSYTWTISGNLPAGLSLSGATISGTPTAAGASAFTAQVSDGSTTATRQLSITIAPPALRITTASLPPAAVGVPYSQPLAAAGGIPPYRWSIAGNLPLGLSLSGAAIAGTPAAPGATSFTLLVTDSALNSAQQTVSLLVSGPAHQITTAAVLPPSVAGSPYLQSLSANGGVPPYAWTVNGGLPPGLALTAGVLSGTPTNSGSFRFEIEVSDSASRTASRVFTLTVAAQLKITTASLADASVGVAYSQAIAAAGGTPPYSWTLISGSLPDGVTLNTSAGSLNGTPRSAGASNFGIQVRDRDGTTATRSYTITTAAGLIITAAPVLSAATVGTSYAHTLTVAGGRAPYTWSIASGALPGGLSLDISTGALGGKPGASGQFQFTIEVTDSASVRASKGFTLFVAPALVVSSAPDLPQGISGVPYTQPLAAAGGTPPYTWSISSGSLPGGLQLDPNTGTISGTPAAAGTFSFTAQVADSLSVTAGKQFSLRIVSELAILSVSLGEGVLGSPYSQPLGAAGGTPPYAWAITDGALPAGLVLEPAAGMITGTPVVSGSFPLTIQVTDASGLTSTRDHLLTIGMPPLPSVTIAGGSDVLQPLQQPTVTVALAAPYPAQITGQLTLGFEPDAVHASDDPAVQFATGGRTASFTIPANTGEASFSIPSMAFQTGTVAGAISVRLALLSGGVDLTPADGAVRIMRVNRSEPQIRSTTLVQTPSGFELRVVGLSPARELVSAVVRLTPVPGGDLQTTDFTVPLGDLAARWYESPASAQFGSQFTLVMPFTVQGNLRSIGGATVRLLNGTGMSEPASASF